MLWPWNPGQGSLKDIERGTVREIVYGFLLVFFSRLNLSSKIHRFRDIRFQTYAATLKTGLGVRQGHWKCHPSIQRRGLYDFPLTWLYFVLFLRYSMSKNVVTLKSGFEVIQGRWNWYHSADVYGFLLVFFSKFVPKTHRFWDIRRVSIQWPWNTG